MPDERREEYAAELNLKRPPPQCWRLLPLLCCLSGSGDDARQGGRNLPRPLGSLGIFSGRACGLDR